MRLDAQALRFMSKDEFRVLTAVEMGQKNHEFVPVPLIESIAASKRHSVRDVIPILCKNKLLFRTNQKYEGFKLTYLGYDYLALRALVKRGLITGVGKRIGVGKESDIHLCRDGHGRVMVIKLHRLGRISFRSIKRNRDYLQRRHHASWMYLARLAAMKEFFYLKALHTNHFPVPEPFDVNRHVLLMEYIDAVPFREVRALVHPMHVLEKLMQLIVRLGQAGLIHGDFNEFNLLIDDLERITLIDLPQMVTMQHANARWYFERDVDCIRSLFARKFSIEVTEAPCFDEILAQITSGTAGTGSSSTKKGTLLPGTMESVKETSVKHTISWNLGSVLNEEELQDLEEAVESRLNIQRESTSDADVCADNIGNEGSEEDAELSTHNDDNIDGDTAHGSGGEGCAIERKMKTRGSDVTGLRGLSAHCEEAASDDESSGISSSSGGLSSDETDCDVQPAIQCYRPITKRHDSATVRKRVHLSEKRKTNLMGNCGRNKNPERMRAKREASYY